jgi:isoleucyl-tRNA synthetase
MSESQKLRRARVRQRRFEFTLDDEESKILDSLEEKTGMHGADILRLWVVSSDYSEDLRIGKEIIKQQAELYRRIRNTIRYILGSLDGYQEEEAVAVEDMPELERWVLHRLIEIDEKVKKGYREYNFHPAFSEIHNFCAVDLSAFYFDIRKDALYCDKPESLRRRACRTVLEEVLKYLMHWLAPVLCFTAEESWLARHGKDAASIHLQTFPQMPVEWHNEALGAKWDKIRAIRSVITGALEVERKEGRIGSSLEAHPEVYVTKEQAQLFEGQDLAEIVITSSGDMIVKDAPKNAFTSEEVPGVGVIAKLASGEKCQRCWRLLKEVGEVLKDHPLCLRCSEAVDVKALAAAPRKKAI